MNQQRTLPRSGGGRFRRVLGGALLLCLVATGVPGSDEDRISQLEVQVRDLQAALAAIQGQPDGGSAQVAELARRLDILAGEIEELKLGRTVVEADTPQHGFGPAASKIYQTPEGRGVSIGGYGEMHYKTYASDRDDGEDAGKTDQLDFLRAIIYFGYKFNNRWLFNSEIEYEHASTSKGGSASVEFAYLDFLWKPKLNVRTGLLLLPMGFVNELHEPPIFLGANRPDIERMIIPSTWRENGAGIFGDVGPFTYRTYIVNGLDAMKFSSKGLRGGRQKGAQAKAEDFAWVGRLDYTGTPGLLVGASAYMGHSGQTVETPAGKDVDVNTSIYEIHLEWKWRGLQFRAMGVQAELDDVDDLNLALGLVGDDSVGERLEGHYLELGYDVLNHRGGQQALIPFVRYEGYDTQARVPDGFARDPARDVHSTTIGFAYKPMDRVIFKLDHRNVNNGAGTGVDETNFSMGYIF